MYVTPIGQSEHWPFRHRPIGDETFSSWFSQVAWANGLTPSELFRVAMPGARLHRLDLDRHIGLDLIERLSAHTGIPASDLLSTTLDRWRGKLFEASEGQEKLLWLPPAGTVQKSQSFGQQLCPECLRHQEVPYLQQFHRLAFVTACPIHDVQLVDRCPRCAAPVQPLYNSSVPGDICRCWSCGMDFREVTAEPAIATAAQASMVQAAEDGWGRMGDCGQVHGLAYFRILWVLYRLLATGRFAYPLRQWVSGNLTLPDIPAAAIPRIKEVERLNPKARGVLVAQARALTADWPHTFVVACREVGISSRALIKDAGETPYALWDVARSQLSEQQIQVSDEEAACARAFLEKRGEQPTLAALTHLAGSKSKSLASVSEPAKPHLPYGTHRYWKLDGVSPDIRAAAKEAAKLDGDNIGAWVDGILRRELKKRALI